MINLQNLSALPIFFNDSKGVISFGDGVLIENSEHIQLKSLTPALLNQTLKYPVDVYYEYHNIRLIQDEKMMDSTGIHYDILFIPEGLLGVEYIKSHIYFSDGTYSSKQTNAIVEVLYGTLTIILQKNKKEDELEFYTEVEKGIVLTVKAGEKALIPAGYFYTFINIGGSSVIFADVHKSRSIADYSIFQKERGLAYFCIRKNARCEIVRNPKYRNTPDIDHKCACDTFDKSDCKLNSPLYLELQSKLDTFLDLILE